MSRDDEIREREQAATLGPWEAKTNRHPQCNGEPWGWIEGASGNITWGGNKGKANAKFIAHAREDIPYLLAEKARLEKEVERLRAELDDPKTVRLPCKVGDTVWRPEALQYSWDIVSIIIYPDELLFIDDSENSFTADAIGKTVFLSRAEAEKAKEAHDER